MPIRVLVRSYNPHTVVGHADAQADHRRADRARAASPPQVRLQPGLNSFTFKQTLAKQQQSYTYEADFQPQGGHRGGPAAASSSAGDNRPENNRATTHVLALGQRRILLIEPRPATTSFF